MSASEIQASEACKGTNVRKIGQSGLKLRIRLPRKRLSDGTQKISTGVAEDSDNLTEKNVPEQTNDNTQSTICAATEMKAEEARSNPPRVPEDTKNLSAMEESKQTDNNTRSAICAAAKVKAEVASSNLLRVPEDAQNLSAKETPKETDNNTQNTLCGADEINVDRPSNNPPGVPVDTKNFSSKDVPKHDDNNTRSTLSMANKLIVEEVNSNHPEEGLYKEASRNIENETLSRDTPPEKVDFIAPSRSPAAASVVQGEEESNYHVTMRLRGEGNKKILDKELSPENSCSTPVKKSCIGGNVKSKAPTKNLASTGVYVEVGKNYSVTVPCEDASNNVLSNRLLCERNRNTSKGLSGEATINCLSKNLTTSALKGKEVNDNPVRISRFEARNCMTTGKLSFESQNNAQSRRAAVLANEKASEKRLCTSADTYKTTSGTKQVPSAVQAVEQSSSAANLKAIEVYKEFEEKVRRTVYLDNLSHLATQSVIKVALNQFGTVRNVNFLINYTVPYDIPQSALVEMETEKDAESVVSMLNEFPFMISGMPRPVRAQRATSVMFNYRPRRPGGKLEFCWVGPTDPDYQNVRKFKLMSKKQEVENLALIKLELEGKKLLAKQQQDGLNCDYRKLETVRTVLTTGCVGRLSHIYNLRFNDGF